MCDKKKSSKALLLVSSFGDLRLHQVNDDLTKIPGEFCTTHIVYFLCGIKVDSFIWQVSKCSEEKSILVKCTGVEV